MTVKVNEVTAKLIERVFNKRVSCNLHNCIAVEVSADLLELFCGDSVNVHQADKLVLAGVFHNSFNFFAFPRGKVVGINCHSYITFTAGPIVVLT